jgi:5-methyltetrahydrofolate--homocysteine methyltransferase
LGSKIVKGISLDDIAQYVNETALYRNQWQYRPEKDESDEDFKSRLRATFRHELATAKAAGFLIPQVVYGYYCVNADGNDVVVWSDESRTTELTRFSYPRQSEAPFMCIADFFRTFDKGPDYAAFHIVTMAEALAELWHKRIREEWGFVNEDGPSIGGLFRQQYRGGRYSWGYPACPDLEDNATVATLLEAGRLGIEVSEETGWQYQPEQTTSAIICHHPQSKYFVAR